MARNKISKDFTVFVQSIHGDDCPQKADNSYIRCNCPKQLVKIRREILDGRDSRRKQIISADTCDYKVAEAKAWEIMKNNDKEHQQLMDKLTAEFFKREEK